MVRYTFAKGSGNHHERYEKTFRIVHSLANFAIHSQITLRQSSGEPHQTTPRMVSARPKRGRIEPHERVLDDFSVNLMCMA
jgi:hypothetical protein